MATVPDDARIPPGRKAFLLGAQAFRRVPPPGAGPPGQWAWMGTQAVN